MVQGRKYSAAGSAMAGLTAASQENRPKHGYPAAPAPRPNPEPDFAGPLDPAHQLLGATFCEDDSRTASCEERERRWTPDHVRQPWMAGGPQGPRFLLQSGQCVTQGRDETNSRLAIPPDGFFRPRPESPPSRLPPSSNHASREHPRP